MAKVDDDDISFDDVFQANYELSQESPEENRKTETSFVSKRASSSRKSTSPSQINGYHTPVFNGGTPLINGISETEPDLDLTDGPDTDVSHAFKAFIEATEFTDILSQFSHICDLLDIDVSNDFRKTYKTIKSNIQTSSQLVHTMWKCLDTRSSQEEYMHGQICMGTKVLIIGCGPCGLRMAIECALLGAKVMIIEARNHISRNNVLHLWPFVINDIKSIGAKVFFPTFCGGNREHVSIQRLQMMLLKLALILGVEIHAPFTFKEIIEPTKKTGWRIKVSPSNRTIDNYQFDVLIGADGKRNSLTEFSRKVFRGSRAIGITANFVYENTPEEKAVEEIGGITYVYRKDLFDKLKNEGGIDLENFVYFKDATHYFVMTARKESLLQKGVLIKDFADTKDLLAKENVQHESLLDYVREAVGLATDHKLGYRQYSKTKKGDEDVSIFDFTALQYAEHSCLVKEKHNQKLLMTIVGDTLLEPFWPTGSGVARGFLGVMDAAWMIRNYCLGMKPLIDVIAEKESHYSVLSQTTVDNVNKNISMKPNRYNMLKFRTTKPADVEHLYVTDKASTNTSNKPEGGDKPWAMTSPQLQEEFMNQKVLRWYQRQLDRYKELVTVWDLSSSWRNGVALCAFVSKHVPSEMNIGKLGLDDMVGNVQKAFAIIRHQYGIDPPLTAEELVYGKVGNPGAMSKYLISLKDTIEKLTPAIEIDHSGSTEKDQEEPPVDGWARFNAVRSSDREKWKPTKKVDKKPPQTQTDKKAEKKSPTKTKLLESEDETDDESLGFFERLFSSQRKKKERDTSKVSATPSTSKIEENRLAESDKSAKNQIKVENVSHSPKHDDSNDDLEEDIGFFARLFSFRKSKTKLDKEPRKPKGKETPKKGNDEEQQTSDKSRDKTKLIDKSEDELPEGDYFERRKYKSDPEVVMRRRRMQQHERRMREIEEGFRPKQNSPEKGNKRELDDENAELVSPQPFKRRFTLFGRVRSSKRQKKSVLDKENNISIEPFPTISDEGAGRRVGTLERLQQQGAVKKRISDWETGQTYNNKDIKEREVIKEESPPSQSAEKEDGGSSCTIL